MLRIRSVSGEVETIELASFLESRAEGRDPVRELKRHLQLLSDSQGSGNGWLSWMTVHWLMRTMRTS